MLGEMGINLVRNTGRFIMKGANMRTKMVVTGVILLTLVAVGIAYAATVKIDSFNAGGQAIVVNRLAPTAWSIVDTTEALGGERDVQLQWTEGNDLNVNLRTNTGGDGLFSYSADPTMKSIGTITWDGQESDPFHGSPPVLNPSGLGSVSLTDAGTNDGIMARITWGDLKADLTFQVHSGANWSQSTLSLPALNPGERMDVFFPFNTIGSVPGFTTGGGGGADFANVGAVVMILDGRVTAGADVMIDLIEATSVREYGDLPIAYGTNVLSANHIPRGLRLGDNVDAETTYHANLMADGDDVDQATPDDEDGVIPLGLPWTAGDTESLLITVSGCTTAGCHLSGWIDWSRNNSFDLGEQVVNATVYGAYSQNAYSFVVPAGFSNISYYARFRVCWGSADCDSPTNADTNVRDGEIEDYRWDLGPTAVELASFTATPQAWTGTIRLDWETLTEVNNLGFNLYRAESPTGRQIKLNADLIPSQGPGSPIGYTYSFMDRAVRAGRTYYYWLEAVDVYGSTQLFGPKSAAIQQLSAPKSKP